MSRFDESAGRMPNPCQFFLEWNNEQKKFCYYSKDEEKSTPFDLPFTFLALKFLNSITGYNEAKQQGIFSNEITDTRYEHFRVKYRDGSVLASGLYADIKDDLAKSGAKFTRSIYAMTPKGALVNIRLRSSQTQSFKSIEKYGKRWQDEWIQVASFEDKVYEVGEKKIDYTVPIFTFAGSISAKDSDNATKAYDLVDYYFKSSPALSSSSNTVRNNSQSVAASMPVTQNIPVSLPGQNDDLPF